MKITEYLIKFINNRDLDYIKRAGLKYYLENNFIINSKDLNLIDKEYQKHLIIKTKGKKYETHGTKIGSYTIAYLKKPSIKILLKSNSLTKQLNDKKIKIDDIVRRTQKARSNKNFELSYKLEADLRKLHYFSDRYKNDERK